MKSKFTIVGKEKISGNPIAASVLEMVSKSPHSKFSSQDVMPPLSKKSCASFPKPKPLGNWVWSGYSVNGVWSCNFEMNSTAQAIHDSSPLISWAFKISAANFIGDAI